MGLTLIDAHCKGDYNGISVRENFYIFCGNFFLKAPFSNTSATNGRLSLKICTEATIGRLRADWR